MKVRFIDIMMIFDIEPCDCNDWPAPGMTLKEDGIWVTPPSEINKEIRDSLTKEELHILINHPTGDYTKPAITIPCERDDLVDFLVDIEFFGFGLITKIEKESEDIERLEINESGNRKRAKEMYVEHYKKEMEKLRESTVIELKKQINDYFPSASKNGEDKKTSMDQCHEILILKAIRDLGYEPLEIYQENGKQGIKKDVWNKLSNEFSRKEIFEYRWKKMRGKGKIKNKQ
ncbi:hypothetical protein [Klebsiella pneumoniae]|uniref:hypothetical protein n=1 Tax=Klebsiella pneumoniae TaxID=573 RepID=UPI0021629B19|nr:hypothetical protein [Klebsiella pneumoniae]UVN35994.1 hypothetical protein NW255_20665 [Klebsiella pneumoniae]